MKYSQKDFENYVTISRNLFWSAFAFIILAFVLPTFNIFWINWVSKFILFLAYIFVAISCLIPGFFVIFGKPWFAQAWLRGINSTMIPSTEWDNLSVGLKSLIYLNSIVIFVSMVFAIIFFIVNKGF